MCTLSTNDAYLKGASELHFRVLLNFYFSIVVKAILRLKKLEVRN